MKHPGYIAAILALIASSSISAGTWVRSNLVGTHTTETRVTVLSDSDRTGAPWVLLAPNGAVARQGTVPGKLAGVSSHNPKPFGTTLSVSLPDTGRWKFVLPGADTATLVRSDKPWGFLAPLLVRHLRLMRSGPDQREFRVASHLGDTACLVMVPDGDWDSGRWKASPTGRRVNAVGGWYDAGDQIKFTLTTAYTTYHLLRAWQANPGLHGSDPKTASLPGILEETRHGLDYLDRMLVDDTTFIVEVGDGEDHEQGMRLPQFDELDGKRPALVASSPMPMAYTAAALALGSRVFGDIDPVRASRWKATALRIHAITTAKDAPRKSAFFRQEVNDFYSDPTPYDNLALMELELFALLGDSIHLNLARSFADSAGASWDPGWTEVGLSVDADLAADWPASRQRLVNGFKTFRTYANTSAPLWGIPAQPQWGPLLGWPVLATEALRSATVLQDTTLPGFAFDLMDYILGRNNWGVSFLMSRRIPRSVRNIYNPIYKLTGEFPEGAIAEGPGSRATHNSLSQWFSIPSSAPETPFNTSTTVFFDHVSDFQTMETTIAQQATMLYLVSTMAKAADDTVPPTLPPVLPDSLETWLASLVRTPVPLSKGRWTVYDDQSEGGISTVDLASTSDTATTAVFDIAKGGTVEYPYAGMVQSLSNNAKALPWGTAIGVLMEVDLPVGRSARLQFRTSDVTDYDYFGASFPGKGPRTEAVVLFRDLSQQGFGEALPAFSPTRTTHLEWVLSAACDSLPVTVRSIALLASGSNGIGNRRAAATPALSLVGRNLTWRSTGAGNVLLELVAANGSRTTLAEHQGREGAIRLPPTAGITWAVLRTEGRDWIRMVPPGR